MRVFFLLVALCAPLRWAAAQQLTGRPCGFREQCLYNDKGDLLYWVTEYHERDATTGAVRNAYITGYTQIKDKQREFNDWLDKKLPGNEKHHVETSGRLNLSTLRIPSVKAFARAISLWERFQLDCRRGVIKEMVKEAPGQGASAASCETSLADYKGSNEIIFPDDTLRTRADAIWDAYAAASAHYRLVGELQPLTAEWNNLNDPDWRRLEETDHIEITQVPPGFMDKLGEAESKMESRAAFADELEAVARQANP